MTALVFCGCVGRTGSTGTCLGRPESWLDKGSWVFLLNGCEIKDCNEGRLELRRSLTCLIAGILEETTKGEEFPDIVKKIPNKIYKVYFEQQKFTVVVEKFNNFYT